MIYEMNRLLNRDRIRIRSEKYRIRIPNHIDKMQTRIRQKHIDPYLCSNNFFPKKKITAKTYYAEISATLSNNSVNR